MYCTFCGTGLPSSALFCSRCGLKIVPQENHNENIPIHSEIKSDSSTPEEEKNPLLSKEFLKSENLGKKMCLGCGLVVNVFSEECLTCKGTLFRWPDSDPNLEASTTSSNYHTNSQTRNQNLLLLNKDSKVLIFRISALVVSLLLIYSLYQSKINPIKNSPSSVTTVESIVPGVTECDFAGDISSDGKYMCAGRAATFYWVLIEDLANYSNEEPSNESNNDSNNGYWTTNCVTTEVPNPLYDGTPTDSRGQIQWPTIKSQKCSQVWVQK
jgi:hypothetical protein